MLSRRTRTINPPQLSKRFGYFTLDYYCIFSFIYFFNITQLFHYYFNIYLLYFVLEEYNQKKLLFQYQDWITF